VSEVIGAYTHQAPGPVHPASGTTHTGAQYDGGGPEGFYATVMLDSRTGFLLGPYSTREAAEAEIPAAKRLAGEADPFVLDFGCFGVTRRAVSTGQELPRGVLMDRRADELATEWAARLIVGAIKADGGENPRKAIAALGQVLDEEWGVPA
jgi:hypothetical protein